MGVLIEVAEIKAVANANETFTIYPVLGKVRCELDVNGVPRFVDEGKE